MQCDDKDGSKVADPDEILVEVVHKALENWKKAEEQAEKYQDNEKLWGKYSTRAAVAKKVYLTVWSEAKKRKVSLKREQLLKRILFPSI